MRWRDIPVELVEQTARVPEWEEYDPEADALYIQLRQAQVEDNIDIEDGVSVDLDGDKHIIGIEVLDASKRLSATDLSNISIERFPVETTVP